MGAAGRVLGAASVVGAAGLASWLVGRARVEKHVGAYAEHWLEPVDVEQGVAVVMVALGHSAVQGVGASVVDNGYVPVLARRLAATTGREVRVINLSISGAVSEDVVEHQLSKLAALPVTPDLVLLDIGANDVVFPGHTLDSFTASMRRILSALPPGSFVADVPWISLLHWGGPSRRFAERSRELAREYGHHAVLLHEPSRALGLVAYRRHIASDLFHPNDRGYAGFAEAFWEVLESTGKVDELRAGAPERSAP